MPRFDLPLGVPDSCTRGRQSNPAGGYCTLPRGFYGGTRQTHLANEGRAATVVFLPVGHAFLGGSRCSTIPLAESVTSCQRKIGLLCGAFIEGVTMIVGSIRYGVPIKFGAPCGYCPICIPPSPSPLLSLHLPAHLRQNEFLRGETCRGRVAFRCSGRCW